MHLLPSNVTSKFLFSLSSDPEQLSPIKHNDCKLIFVAFLAFFRLSFDLTSHFAWSVVPDQGGLPGVFISVAPRIPPASIDQGLFLTRNKNWMQGLRANGERREKRCARMCGQR